MTEHKDRPFTAEDIRFTTKDNTLYTILLDWPDTNQVTIKTLAESNANLSKIKSIELLGSTRASDGPAMRKGYMSRFPPNRPASTPTS